MFAWEPHPLRRAVVFLLLLGMALTLLASPALASTSKHGTTSCSSQVWIRSYSRDTTRHYAPDGTLRATYYNYPNWTWRTTSTTFYSTSWQIWVTQARFFNSLDHSRSSGYCSGVH